MPTPKPVPGTAQDWLDRARGKLVLAKIPLPSGCYWEDLCFHAQQAAELAIKAVYQHHGWTFEYVHNLGKLLDGLQHNGLGIPPEVQRADQLSIYAAITRYPGIYPPVTELMHQEATRIADAVVSWAESLIP